MHCPLCSISLRHYKHSCVAFDICPECRGIHVKNEQLQALAVNVAAEGQVEPSGKLTFKVRQVLRPSDESPVLRCPACGESMKEFNYAYDSNVFLDRCPKCRGIWLDPNEIIDIAKHIQYNPDVDAVAGAIIKEDRQIKDDESLMYMIAGLVLAILRMLVFR